MGGVGGKGVKEAGGEERGESAANVFTISDDSSLTVGPHSRAARGIMKFLRRLICVLKRSENDQRL